MNSISNYTNIYSPRNWKNNEKYCYFYGCVLHARLTCSVASILPAIIMRFCYVILLCLVKLLCFALLPFI